MTFDPPSGWLAVHLAGSLYDLGIRPAPWYSWLIAAGSIAALTTILARQPRRRERLLNRSEPDCDRIRP